MMSLAASASVTDSIRLTIHKHPQNVVVGSVVPRSVSRRRANVITQAGGDNEPLGEDLIERLKAAEEEAQRLRTELAAAKSQTSDSSSSDEATDPRPAKAASRIDGGDLRRETLAFVDSRSRNWLNESDVEFFTGAGPSEAEGASGSTEQESAIVQRRILIGLGLTAAVGAFALVPTEKLQPAPSKPLFFYLAPLIRVQSLLQDIENVIPDGDYARLRSILSLVEGPPNNIQDNIRSAVALLPSSQAQKAETIARDLYEYIRGIDYQTYYDSMPGGKEQERLFEYSLQSTKAAQIKIKEFLKLMPRDQVEAAESQVNAFAS